MRYLLWLGLLLMMNGCWNDSAHYSLAFPGVRAYVLKGEAKDMEQLRQSPLLPWIGRYSNGSSEVCVQLEGNGRLSGSLLDTATGHWYYLEQAAPPQGQEVAMRMRKYRNAPRETERTIRLRLDTAAARVEVLERKQAFTRLPPFAGIAKGTERTFQCGLGATAERYVLHVVDAQQAELRYYAPGGRAPISRQVLAAFANPHRAVAGLYLLAEMKSGAQARPLHIGNRLDDPGLTVPPMERYSHMRNRHFFENLSLLAWLTQNGGTADYDSYSMRGMEDRHPARLRIEQVAGRLQVRMRYVDETDWKPLDVLAQAADSTLAAEALYLRLRWPGGAKEVEIWHLGKHCYLKDNGRMYAYVSAQLKRP